MYFQIHAQCVLWRRASRLCAVLQGVYVGGGVVANLWVTVECLPHGPHFAALTPRPALAGFTFKYSQIVTFGGALHNH